MAGQRPKQRPGHLRPGVAFAGGLLLLGLVSLLALLTGPYELAPASVLKALFTWPGSTLEPSMDTAHVIVWEIRMPRIGMAVLVGASLSVAGVAVQGLFRNPLAEPALIGISSGSALGAILSIVVLSNLAVMTTTLQSWLLPWSAFLGGAVATLAIYRISRRFGDAETSLLLLTGLAINALCGAGVGLLIYLSGTEELRQFVFWSLGSMARAEWTQVTIAAVVMLPAAFALSRFSSALDLFLMGERTAFFAGVDTERAKLMIILLVAVLVGTAVGFCGTIGFVGLVVPHLSRLLIGSTHGPLFPVSAVIGACVVCLADLAARTIDAPAELPIGILTAGFGAPFFLHLVMREQRRANPS